MRGSLFAWGWTVSVLLLLVGCGREPAERGDQAEAPPIVMGAIPADPVEENAYSVLGDGAPEEEPLVEEIILQETETGDSVAWNNSVGFGGGAGGMRGGRGGRGGRKGGGARQLSPQLPTADSLSPGDLFDDQDPAAPDRFLDPGRRALRLEVYDGYGRRYCDDEVLLHLEPRPQESARDMFYRYYGDNPAVNARLDPLSTFAADVDTASYTLARRYLVEGQIPPKEAVRTEEFVNYFPSELAAPEEGDFAIHLEYAPSRFASPVHGLLKVGIKARVVDRNERKPLVLTWVVDCSGSMLGEHRLGLVQRCLKLLLGELRPDDQVAIVRFGSDADMVLPPTSASERQTILAAVDRLHSNGSTNADAGLKLGYVLAEAAFRPEASNRVVLCSDGVANTGETDQARILEQVRDFSRRQIDLTTIGVGFGNHNDVFLEQLADGGNGACHYVDDQFEGERLLVGSFLGTMQTVARDVKIQVEFERRTVFRWRQLGYENRRLRDQDFRRDEVDAGEVGAGHEVVALYEVEESGAAMPGDLVATVRLRWKPDGAEEAVELERVLRFGDKEEDWQLASARFRLSAVAAQFAEVLRRSSWSRGDSILELVHEADRLAGELPETPAPELAQMIRRAEGLDRLRPAAPGELGLLLEEARRLRLLELECRDAGPGGKEVRALLQQLQAQNRVIERKLDQLLRQGG